MDTIMDTNNSQNIQTEKSMATKSLNLKTHFSEIKKEWADAKSVEKKKKVMWHIAFFYDRWFQTD